LSAHRWRRGAGPEQPATVGHGGRRRPHAAVALRRSSGDGKRFFGSNSARQTRWWLVASIDSGCAPIGAHNGESCRGRRARRLNFPQGGGPPASARQEDWAAAARAPALYRQTPRPRREHARRAERQRRHATAMLLAAGWASAGPAGPERVGSGPRAWPNPIG
jgi:hypothetical protein